MFAFVRFPLELDLLLTILEPASHDHSSAVHVYGFLDKMTCYCEEFSLTNEMREDLENENVWVRTKSFSPFTGTWNGDCC